jgi:PTH1 family peptidyl-tRNA hydrolase
VAQAIVGLGNPGPEYRNTRHNVGQRGVVALAQSIHARVERDGGPGVAHGGWQGDPLDLIKPGSLLNLTGAPVARLARKFHLGPADLIIVFDDLDLPLGKVRVRTSGSAGGHNGVRSLIAAFGTNDLRRVKIGIGRPGRPGEDRDRVSDHVLSPFFPEEQEAIAAACDQAADEALRLVERR